MAAYVPIDRQEVVCLILDFLKNHGYAQSQRALEAESGTKLEINGREVDFVQELVLDGLWEEVESFLAPLQTTERFDSSTVLFEIRKQAYLELIHSQQLSQAVLYLVDKLKLVEASAPRGEFEKLCYVLTLSRLSSHPDYRRWTPAVGRAACWAAVKPYLETIYGAPKPNQQLHSNQLLRILRGYLHQQVHHGVPMDRTSLYRDGNDAPAITAAQPYEQMDPRRSNQHSYQQQQQQQQEQGQLVIRRPSANADTAEPRYEPEPQTPRSYDLDDSAAPLGQPTRERWRHAGTLQDSHTLRSLAWSPNGDAMVTGGNAGTLTVASILPVLESAQQHAIPLAPMIELRGQHAGSVYSVAWNSSGELIASGSNDRTVKVLRLHPQTLQLAGPSEELTGHGGTVRCIDFQANSSLLACACSDGMLHVWDAATSTQLGAISAHDAMPGCVSVKSASDGRTFLSAGGDRMRLWDTRTMRMTRDIPLPSLAVDAAISPDHCLAAVSVYSETAEQSRHNDACLLIDLRAMRTLVTWMHHSAKAASLDFSRDSLWLATGGFDGRVAALPLSREVAGPTDDVSNIVSSAEGRVACVRWRSEQYQKRPMLASCGTECCVKLWTLLNVT
eukprot:TRINITY_DN2854_c4_g1_i1.p1 TRINITY_DN2854_c4_g1~~TRINITY_DN2854_c4_g1_i1.p1  ORF type:complete len:616 (-),score=112.88 TRINITY_DN2854_c4_g1_i1:76-1923(-)